MTDAIDNLVQFATDPTFDVADPATVGALQQGIPDSSAVAPSLDFRLNPSFETGGLIAPDAQGGAAPVDIQQEASRIAQQHPAQVAQIRQAIEQGLQTGELTPDELNLIIQLATAAAQNPSLYPQLRAFAIQQGLATEQELSPQYDKGLVFVILLIAQAAQAQTPGPIPQSQGQPPAGSFANGGGLPADSPNPDGSIPINAHEGEFVIPAHVVRAKGTDFFNKMISSGDANGQAKPKAG